MNLKINKISRLACLLGLICLTFSSCSKSDNDPVSNPPEEESNKDDNSGDKDNNSGNDNTGGNTGGDDKPSESGPTTQAHWIIVSPQGSDTASGTLESPLSLTAALKKVAAGDTLYMRGGTYSFNSTIKITSPMGTESAPVVWAAYPGDERPVLDFSGTSTGTTGISVRVNYWVLKGFDVCHSGKNGIRVEGNSAHCVFENLATYENQDTGFQLSGGASNNLVKNCDSYYNKDVTNENADGFAIKMDVGTGNHLVGCRSWMNADDGYDGYLRMDQDYEVVTTYDNCIAYMNGYLKDGSVGKGDGNGFKLGGCDEGSPRRHSSIVRHCMAAKNLHKGFDRNSTFGSMTILNCSGYENGVNFTQPNFAFYSGKGAELATGMKLTVKNCVSYSSIGKHISNSTIPSDVSNNTWDLKITCSSSDFESFDVAQLIGKRDANGNLPAFTFMRPKSSSALVDKGLKLELISDYSGSAPDLGWLESK